MSYSPELHAWDEESYKINNSGHAVAIVVILRIISLFAIVGVLNMERMAMHTHQMNTSKRECVKLMVLFYNKRSRVFQSFC